MQNFSGARKFRKIPVEIEAVQWTGDNFDEIKKFVGEAARLICETDQSGGSFEYLAIMSIEGTMQSRIGDFIIKGVKGEFYPCQIDIFKETYTPAEYDGQPIAIQLKSMQRY